MRVTQIKRPLGPSASIVTPICFFQHLASNGGPLLRRLSPCTVAGIVYR